MMSSTVRAVFLLCLLGGMGLLVLYKGMSDRPDVRVSLPVDSTGYDSLSEAEALEAKHRAECWVSCFPENPPICQSFCPDL